MVALGHLLQDHRTGADRLRLDRSGVYEFAREDREVARAERDKEVRVRRLERDLQCCVVDCLDLVDVPEVGGMHGALRRRIALVGVLHILGLERAAIQRRDVLPLDPGVDLEGEGLPIRLLRQP
ncbi:MAG: hypothetical protein R3B97_05580 [Dehalococcoidia bacterium]